MMTSAGADMRNVSVCGVLRTLSYWHIAVPCIMTWWHAYTATQELCHAQIPAAAGYGDEAAAPQAPPVARTTSIALRDCALRYEPPSHNSASSSLTDASPVAAALLVGSMDTRIEPAAPVCLLQKPLNTSPAGCLKLHLPIGRCNASTDVSPS